MGDYSQENIQIFDFEEAIRKRPALFGYNGIVAIFTNLINDCIKSFGTDKIIVSVSILGKNNFSFKLLTEKANTNFLSQFQLKENITSYNTLKILKILSNTFEINVISTFEILIYFEFDRSVFPETNIDCLKLSENLFQIAVLNQNVEIIMTDTRQKYLIQHYFHFPQGIFYLFDRIIVEVLGKPKFKILYDGQIGENKYQIGLAYRTDWYPLPEIVSFANEIRTIHGGDLVDGIIEGLISACRLYVKNNDLKTFKIRQKKIYNGLIIVCSVRGKEFSYGGSFKEKLADKKVQKESKKIVKKLVYDFFCNNKKETEHFLWRFDEKQFMSGIF